MVIPLQLDGKIAMSLNTMKTREEVLALFHDKYEYLKSVYPEVGSFEEIRLYQNPDGGWQMNLENCAAITLRPGDDQPLETHGAICARWYQEGGAFNERGEPGRKPKGFLR